MSDEPTKQASQIQPIPGVTLIPAPGAGDWYTLEASELRNYQHEAGELRAVIQHEHLHTRDHYNPNGYGSRPDPPPSPIRIVKTLFLFQRSEESAIGRLTGELKRKTEENEGLSRAAERLLREKKDLQDQLDKATKDLVECKRLGERSTSALLGERDKTRRMEEDLGKVRRAIGDLRMKEIIAGE